jgi:hypothetical protein
LLKRARCNVLPYLCKKYCLYPVYSYKIPKRNVRTVITAGESRSELGKGCWIHSFHLISPLLSSRAAHIHVLFCNLKYVYLHSTQHCAPGEILRISPQGTCTCFLLLFVCLVLGFFWWYWGLNSEPHTC